MGQHAQSVAIPQSLPWKRLILQTNKKIQRKIEKLATTTIFPYLLSEEKGDLYKQKIAKF